MFSQNDDGDTGPGGLLSGAGVKVEYIPGQYTDAYGMVVPGLGVVGVFSGKSPGDSIPISHLADGGSSAEDGEVGESVWAGGPVPAESVSVFGQVANSHVDVDGDTFAPEALQQIAHDLKAKGSMGLLAAMTQKWNGPGFLAPSPMPGSYTSWLDSLANAAAATKRTIKPVLHSCDCGSPYALQDIQTSTTDMAHLDVLLRCTGCKKKKSIPFQPQGDEHVGPSYDAVAISYFKQAEES